MTVSVLVIMGELVAAATEEKTAVATRGAENQREVGSQFESRHASG